MENKVKFDISLNAILKVALVAIGIWFIYTVRDIFILLFFVLIIVAALAPLVSKMSKIMPRILAVIILAVIFLGVLTAIGFLIIPTLVTQIGQLATNMPVILNHLNSFYQQFNLSINNSQTFQTFQASQTFQEMILKLSSQVGGLTAGIYTTTIGFISGIVAVITVLVLSFYLLLEQTSIQKFIHDLVPSDHEDRISGILHKIGLKMGNWLRGQGILMLVVGLADGIVLSILGVPYILILAIWGGLTEAIPYIGPWLGLIPAVIIAFTVSPITALFVLIAYILIQQIEGHFLVPKIMGKAIGLSPVIIIIAILIGAKLAGILGIIIAVPAAGALSVIIQDWREIKQIWG